MSLTVAIATRGRPEILIPTVKDFLANLSRKDTTLLIMADEDDQPTIDAVYKEGFPDLRVMLSIKPREPTRGMKYDRALTEAPADLYIVAADHSPILTPGFDQKFLDAAKVFPDGIGCVMTGMANASFPYYQAPTAKMVELMGSIQPHHFPFWFIDHWLDDVARMTGRYVMVDVQTHSNRRPGKTIGLRDLYFWAEYYDALVEERLTQVARIIEAIDEPDWRKELLKRNIPLQLYRSNWVNDQVRANYKAMEAQRGDKTTPTLTYLQVLNDAIGHYLALTEPEKAAA